MPLEFFVATTNAGKLRDFRAAVKNDGAEHGADTVQLKPLPNIGDIPAPSEDESTFEGNARIKAIYYSKFAPGAWVLADDSGLEVDSLEGRPGVRSARFAEDSGSLHSERGVDASNNEALLLAMLEETNRTGRYRCALVLARDGVVETIHSGSVGGEILSEPEGEGGFGYDPLFYVPELGCTMAQASMEDRLRVSHRGRALRSLMDALAV